MNSREPLIIITPPDITNHCPDIQSDHLFLFIIFVLFLSVTSYLIFRLIIKRKVHFLLVFFGIFLILEIFLWIKYFFTAGFAPPFLFFGPLILPRIFYCM